MPAASEDPVSREVTPRGDHHHLAEAGSSLSSGRDCSRIQLRKRSITQRSPVKPCGNVLRRLENVLSARAFHSLLFRRTYEIAFDSLST